MGARRAQKQSSQRRQVNKKEVNGTQVDLLAVNKRQMGKVVGITTLPRFQVNT